jgi:hypothetical protein
MHASRKNWNQYDSILKIAKRWIMIVFGFSLLLIGIHFAIPGVPGPGILINC